MGLTQYIQDLGRPIAYYPKLKKVTSSTTASIFLCQLLYWTDKTEDGWLWKTSNDIEEETGLTYNEQRTARKVLLDLDLIEEEYKRLDHYIKFKVKQEVLNALWEEGGGESITMIERKKKEIKEKLNVVNQEIAQRRSKKQGDWLDVAIGEKAEAATLVEIEKDKIRQEIEKKLNLVEIASLPKWLSFIDFAYNRKKKHGESIDVFLNWTINNPAYSPEYWTPAKMKTLWSQAFLADKIDETFVKTSPVENDYEESDYSPPPEGFGSLNTLFNLSNLEEEQE